MCEVFTTQSSFFFFFKQHLKRLSPRELSQWTPSSLKITHLPTKALLNHTWSPSFSFEGVAFLARLWHAQPWRYNALHCAGYKTSVQQVCVGLYWVVASQLQHSSHRLVTHVSHLWNTGFGDSRICFSITELEPDRGQFWAMVSYQSGSSGWQDTKGSSPHTYATQQMEGESFKQVNPQTGQLWPLFKFANSRNVGPRP